MVMGGIPYYMSMMDKSLSLAQNIDRLFFAPNALLSDEFKDLYQALFKNAGPYISIVSALGSKGKGMTRQELLSATKLTNNGAFSTALEELENCGFIRRYLPFGKTDTRLLKRQTSQILFQLIDPYTLFFFRFINQNMYHDEHFWSTSINSPLHNTWSGLAFEMLCLCHLNQIKQALGIAGIQTMACAWRSTSSPHGTQVDLLIDRKDQTINLCEMKYTNSPFAISKEYEAKLAAKIDTFIQETRTKKTVILTLVSSYGIQQNPHSDIVQRQVLLDDLFKA